MSSETKPFYLTSEFWLTMFVNVAALVALVVGKISFEVAMGVWTGASGLYSVARGMAKAGVPPATPPLSPPPPSIAKEGT